MTTATLKSEPEGTRSPADAAGCVNLRERFGDRYRVWNELEGRRPHQRDDPWDFVLPGRAGFVAPWGPDTLVAVTNSILTTRRLLAAVPAATVVQDGSDGQNVTFKARHLDAVAGILRLQRRRRLTGDPKARLLASRTPAERAASLAEARRRRQQARAS